MTQEQLAELERLKKASDEYEGCEPIGGLPSPLLEFAGALVEHADWLLPLAKRGLEAKKVDAILRELWIHDEPIDWKCRQLMDRFREECRNATDLCQEIAEAVGGQNANTTAELVAVVKSVASQLSAALALIETQAAALATEEKNCTAFYRANQKQIIIIQEQRAALAERDAEIERWKMATGCVNPETIAQALSRIHMSLDCSPGEGIPDGIAKLKAELSQVRGGG